MCLEVFSKCWWWLMVLHKPSTNVSSHLLRSIEIACPPNCGDWVGFVFYLSMFIVLCLLYFVQIIWLIRASLWPVEFLFSRSASPHYLTSVLQQNHGRSLKGKRLIFFRSAPLVLVASMYRSPADVVYGPGLKGLLDYEKNWCSRTHVYYISWDWI